MQHHSRYVTTFTFYIKYGFGKTFFGEKKCRKGGIGRSEKYFVSKKGFAEKIPRGEFKSQTAGVKRRHKFLVTRLPSSAYNGMIVYSVSVRGEHYKCTKPNFF